MFLCHISDINTHERFFRAAEPPRHRKTLAQERMRATFAGLGPSEGPAQVLRGPMHRDSRFLFKPLHVSFFDCGWSLFNHGVVEIGVFDLDDLNPMTKGSLGRTQALFRN